MNLGKLEINGLTFKEFFEEVEKSNYQILDIKKHHLFINTSLDWHHRDPFDRIIISQAIAEKMEVLSSDGMFDLYPINRIR